MADPQTSPSQPSGSLPASLINPDDMSYFAQPGTGTTPPKWVPTPVVFTPPNPIATTNQQPLPAPAPQLAVQPQPSLPPATAPAVAPPTQLVPPPAAAPTAPAPAPAEPPQHPPTYVAVGDSLAAGIAHRRKFNERYDVADNPASKADTSIMAASGRTTAQTLSVINANPQQFAGQDVLLSTGMSNDLMGGGKLDDAMTNVASQLDALRKAGANVALAGVGSGVPGYQQANARLAQLAKAYNIPFTGEPSTTQGGRVHPHDWNAFYGQFHFGQQQPPTPGTGKTIDDATAYIQQREGGGPFILYGHEGQPYDPNSMPTKPGYYGFPDWAGGYGPDGRQTHAAGGAQWEPDTWKTAVEGFTQEGLANQLGHTPDFRNPADQKAVFNYWAARRYREQTGRDIVADMNAGHVDWASLGSEWSSLKYAGSGGVAGMTVGNVPTYQDWRRSIEEQRQTLADESTDQLKRLEELEAGSPEQRALADQLLKKQMQLMDRYEQMIDHPPTQKPADILANFGSIATLIGIFAGRFAHRPMVASLNAAGAAMQAMNDNDAAAYKNAFDTWKIQTDMTSKLIGMESDTYKGIMDDQHKTMDEKIQEMKAAADIYHNRLLSQQLETGEYEKALEIPNKLAETQKNWTDVQKNLIELNEQRDLQAAAADDDQAYLAAHPEAGGVVPPQVHLDNLARRQAEISEAGKAPTAATEGEREVQAAVTADDQAWLKEHPEAKGVVPQDVHYQNYLKRKTQLSQTTAAGIRAANNPQALALQKYLEENPGADSKSIQDFIQRMHPGRSGIAMAVTKFMEENPNATSADITNFYASLSAQVTAERNWSTGPLGNTVRSIDVSIDHLATLSDLSNQLGNTGSRTFNLLQNKLRTEFGDPAVPNFDTAKEIVGAEVTKAIQGGAGSLTDREGLRKNFDAASTPEQLAGVISSLKRLMAGQLSGLRRQYMQSTGRDDFDDKLSPEAKRELEALSPGGGGGTSTPLPAGVPQGSVLAGTKDGHPVYKTPDGRLLQVQP